VEAKGPWAGSVRGSKGAHIAVSRERIGNRGALTLLSPRDGRVLFALPAGSAAIIGTTDTYTDSPPDEVRASNEDVQYLLDSANAFFPHAELTTNDVISAWAGIRPLLPALGATPGAVSREHAITSNGRGAVCVSGGKLTTYRIMAAHALEMVATILGRTTAPEPTRDLPLPGGDFGSLEALVEAIEHTTHDREIAEHLARFGTRWPTVWNEINQPGGDVPLHEGLPYTIGELRYSVVHEMAATLADLLVRRTHLAFETRDHGMAAAELAAHLLSPVFGWDKPARVNAIRAYAAEAERMFRVDASERTLGTEVAP
jgi:glycerol-3-phosphate dehydrogenase